MATLTRKELYDRVWTNPMTKLAKQFGLSDVALHKICRKHHLDTAAGVQAVTQVLFPEVRERDVGPKRLSGLQRGGASTLRPGPTGHLRCPLSIDIR